MLLALTHPTAGVAPGLVVEAAGGVAVAGLAAPGAKVVEVVIAAVALVPGHPGFALASPLTVALQAAGP